MHTWPRAQERLKKALGEGNFDTWIKPLRVAECGAGRVLFEAPSKFYRDWVNKHYIDALRASFGDESHPSPSIQFRIQASRQQELFQPAAASAGPDSARRPPDGSGKANRRRANARVGNLVPRFTFSNFVVGSSNEFAHAAALAVAKNPGEQYNPLFIYGTVGIGKTHLANAIGHRVLERNSMAKVVFLSSEAFVNDMISSLKRDRMDDFKNRFRKVDLLILDDVQFLAGRERTQEEFFHTFNTLHEGRKQIVLTSDKFPKDIPDLEQRLRNRFESGLTADIQNPEIETRAAIAQKKAEAGGFALSPEVASFIAREIGDNVRELEGALTRLAASASLQGCEISLAFAQDVLKPHFRSRPRELTIEDIQKVVCEHYGVTLVEMNSKRRTQHIAPVRQCAMYLCRKLTSFSFPVIGDAFGNRHHSTVMHAHETVSRRTKNDPGLAATLETLEMKLTRGRAS